MPIPTNDQFSTQEHKKNKKINTQTVKRIQEGKMIRKQTGQNHRGNERFQGFAGGLDRTTEEMGNPKSQREKPLGSLSNKFEQAQEKKITELEERSFVSVKQNKREVENHKEKMKELWDTLKKSNVQIIGKSGGEELQVEGTENILK